MPNSPPPLRPILDQELVPFGYRRGAFHKQCSCGRFASLHPAGFKCRPCATRAFREVQRDLARNGWERREHGERN